MTSLAPPAGNGTMILMGRAGHVWVAPGPVVVCPITAASVAETKLRLVIMGIVPY
jgi:hypothetical protein